MDSRSRGTNPEEEYFARREADNVVERQRRDAAREVDLADNGPPTVRTFDPPPVNEEAGGRGPRPSVRARIANAIGALRAFVGTRGGRRRHA